MKSIHIVFAFMLIGTGIMFSCTEKIDIPLKGSYPRLVVEGNITSDMIFQEVVLSRSTSYYDSLGPYYISNAYVTISTNDTVMWLPEDLLRPGHYLTQSPVAGIPNKTYTLRIDSIDINNDQIYESYEASEKMPPVNSVDSIKLAYYEFYDFFQILVWALDPPTREWYLFKTLINNRMITDTITEVFLTDDEIFNGNPTNGIPSQFLDQKKAEQKLNEGDTVIFELNSVSEAYFKFIYELQTEVFPQNPLFSGPPANISTNIRKINQNGPEAVGFFAAYSISRQSVIYDPNTVIYNPFKK